MSDQDLSGFLQVRDTSSHLGSMEFIIQKLISKLWTVALVQVQSCTNMGTVTAVGSVNVIPLVHQQNLLGQTQPHIQIYNLPYFRLQGGNAGQNNNTNAIIIDPQQGDIGLALFERRDITNVVKNKKASPPGSWRQFDPADGLYLGGFLNAVPNQYLQFVQPTDDNDNVQGINLVDNYKNMIQMGKAGITITDTNNNIITMNNDGIELQDDNNQVIQMESGQISMTTDLLAVSGNITSNGKHVGYTHIHSGVTTGTGETGTPAN